MTTAHTDIKSKVAKLLAHAADQEGTPEAASFYNKAFDLMARYGIEQSELDDPNEDNRPTHAVIEFSGSYTECQSTLLHGICMALHCEDIGTPLPHSTKMLRTDIFGMANHVERVQMLFSLLNPQMLTLANKQPRRYGVPVRTAKRSFMRGFAEKVLSRLQEAETTVANEAPGQAVAVRSDRDRAKDYLKEYLEKHGLRIATTESKAKTDAHSFNSGQNAADRTDLGQKRMNAQRALC